MKWLRHVGAMILGLMILGLLLFAGLGVTFIWNRLAEKVFS